MRTFRTVTCYGNKERGHRYVLFLLLMYLYLKYVMKKIIRLKESELIKLVKNVVEEQYNFSSYLPSWMTNWYQTKQPQTATTKRISGTTQPISGTTQPKQPLQKIDVQGYLRGNQNQIVKLIPIKGQNTMGREGSLNTITDNNNGTYTFKISGYQTGGPMMGTGDIIVDCGEQRIYDKKVNYDYNTSYIGYSNNTFTNFCNPAPQKTLTPTGYKPKT